jgi:predicted Zn-dependent protease
VIDEPETVNAWCMAGGRMALYTGLIQKVDPTDDELAQVMGHEIAHALANHTAERMSIAMASQMGVIAVGVASDQPGRNMALAATAAQLAVLLPNSRTAETEADRIGIELAAKAGYDPNAAATLWQKMGAVGGKNPPQFLSTHPAPGNRQQTLTRSRRRWSPTTARRAIRRRTRSRSARRRAAAPPRLRRDALSQESGTAKSGVTSRARGRGGQWPPGASS